MKMEYASLSSDKVNVANPVFIPIGSIEIHGSSLPLGTDTYISMAFAKQFAEKTTGAVLPPLFYGICPNTGMFKGTVSLSHDCFSSMLTEICHSLISNGFSKIFIINIHNGNDASIKTVVEKIFIEKQISICYINPYTFMRNEIDELLFKNTDNNFKETSLLFAALELLGLKGVVNIDGANDDISVSRPEELTFLRKYGTIGFTYYTEDEHICLRKDANATVGLQYMKYTSDKIPEIVRNLDKHIKKIKTFKRVDDK